MLIILEGPDGGGKSSLAGRLKDTLALAYPDDIVEVFHKGPPTQHPLDEYERPLFDYRPGAGRHIICDRWHIGEWVYPHVLNRPSVADDAAWHHLDMFLSSRGAVLVSALPPHRNIATNIITRGDDLISVGDVPQLIELYAAAFRRTNLPVYDYNYENNPIAESEIISLARTRESVTRRLNGFVTYVGPTNPKYLLLGDVRHAMRDIAHLIHPSMTVDAGPAFGPYPGTSGHFLLNNLPSAMVDQMGLANACDVDNCRALYNVLGKPLTITLGNKAWLVAREFAVASAPHPQFIRRFHHGHGPEYGQVIYEALQQRSLLRGWRPTTQESSAA